MPCELDEALETIRQHVTPITGTREIVVLDRGWIFAGHVTVEDGVLRISNAVNVRHWKTGGFGGLTKGAKSSGAVLDPSADIVCEADSPIFRVPIAEGWNDA